MSQKKGAPNGLFKMQTNFSSTGLDSQSIRNPVSCHWRGGGGGMVSSLYNSNPASYPPCSNVWGHQRPSSHCPHFTDVKIKV